jgi:hypothetical protein
MNIEKPKQLQFEMGRVASFKRRFKFDRKQVPKTTTEKRGGTPRDQNHVAYHQRGLPRNLDTK